MAEKRVEIIEDRCVGCGICEDACPFGAISIQDRKAVIDYEKCTLCGACASVCKTFDAISVTEEHAYGSTGEGDVWVLCEPGSGNELAHVSLELLGVARILAEKLQVGVGAVLIGHNVSGLAQDAVAAGADKVYVAEHDGLARYLDEPYAQILKRTVEAYHPEILLGGATAVGRALLPRLAVLLDTGLTADCTELSIDPETGLLHQTRPAFGGNILATITCEQKRPQMATVRPGVLPPAEACPEREGKVVTVDVYPEDLISGLTWLSFHPKKRGGVDLRESEIVVTAGSGAGGAEGVELVSRLADALGGCLGASRAAVDAGWVEYPHQVGQTGTTVQPKLYIACGVSGAIQHIVGMQNSETIVAINNDPEAPIFAYADIGIVGDLSEIVPALLRAWSGRGPS